MTSLFESVPKEDTSLIPKQVKYKIPRRYVLSSRENFIPKCSKCYKRKYKKHRLRKNELEDEEVLNVSSILTSSLTIQSPRKGKSDLEVEPENLRPKNYLSKMVRKRQNVASETAFNKAQFNQNEHLQESSTSQEKKSTNALQLLMDSRNKTLGSNSPGKEKSIDESEMKDIMEKKSLKTKRNLVLQQMAEAKGSLKKKEIEEYQDKLIKKKMEKRAKKLKSMILHKEPKVAQIENGREPVTKPRNPLNSLNDKKNEKSNDKPAKTLQLVNLFEECNENSIETKIKTIPKEDREFLKKLSPSIKKKESMLSYFNKVEKEENSIENDSDVIKVKFTPKSKKKGRKKKLSLKKEDVKLDDDASCQQKTILQDNKTIADENSDKINLPEQNSKIAKKRKRKMHDVDILGNNNLDDSFTMDTLNHNGARPKRNAKKPIKYSENYISSSDEELHIFTPKKKKQSDPKSTTANDVVVEQDINKYNGEELKSKVKLQKNDKISTISKKEKKTKDPKQEKKHVKLAPIFTSKHQLDPAAIEAKQRFLKSGVPDQLKKIIAKQKEKNVVTNTFFKVVHIQQLDSPNKVVQSLLEINYEEIDDTDVAISGKKIFEQLLNLNIYSDPGRASHFKTNNNTQYFLQHLKESYQKFPVYRTYKLMRSKKKGEFKQNYSYLDLENSVDFLNGSLDVQVDNPDQLNWCDKYKPLAANQIVGNFNSIRELKKWLVTWTENEVKSKGTTKSYESDSSDFCYSDVDSRDSTKNFNNLLILSGPIGSGKTSSVYAVANELSIKVIEVNASSKRTGKIMLQDLQEATQSHKVNRGTGSNENSQKSQEIVTVPAETNIKKRGRPKNNLENAPKKLVAEKNDKSTLTSSQDGTRTAMSLILIDDADIVFDQDDGFCSAIVQLVQCSKRPVILITGTLTCPHLNRFMQGSKVLTMNPLLPNMLGTWLDIMCLADSGMCYPGAGAKLLDFFKGDIRKTINCLQFYVCSQTLNDEETCSQNIDEKISNTEENSNISWSEPEHFEAKNVNKVFELDSIWTNHSNKHIDLFHFRNDLEFYNIWWSVPKLLSMPEFKNIYQKKGSINDNLGVDDKAKDKIRLQSLSRVLDVISECDYMSLSPSKDRRSSLTSHPWVSYENDSVLESENFNNYDFNHELNKEICYEYMKGSIVLAQEKLQLGSKFDLDIPGTAVQRKRDKLISKHTDLSNSFSSQVVLDRRALALDYWSSCRTICRIEKTKTDSSYKRNNRFCHYLKSLSIYCKNDAYDALGDSLCPNSSKTTKHIV